MVDLCPVVKWSVIQMVVRKPESLFMVQMSSIQMVGQVKSIYNLNTRHTYSPIFRCLVFRWSRDKADKWNAGLYGPDLGQFSALFSNAVQNSAKNTNFWHYWCHFEWKSIKFWSFCLDFAGIHVRRVFGILLLTQVWGFEMHLVPFLLFQIKDLKIWTLLV